MYKSIVLIIIISVLFFWIYITIKTNYTLSPSSIYEPFTGNQLLNTNDSPDDNYLKSLKKDLEKMTSQMSNPKLLGKNKLENNSQSNNLVSLIDGLKGVLTKKKPRSTCQSQSLEKESNPTPLHLSAPKCRFMPSFSDKYKCPSKYSQHMGAVLGSNLKNGMLCNGQKIKAQTAKAYAIVRNGKIKKIKITDRGSHYSEAPRIKIIGNGTYARAKSTLDQHGSLQTLRMIHQGEGYTQSPKIIIDDPNSIGYCHMCCQFPT